MNQIPNIEELKTEFTKWHTAETTFAYGIPDDETIADWWLEKLHQQIQKALEEAYQDGRAYEAQQCRGSAADNHPNAPYELPELYPWKDAFNRLTTENDHS